MMFLFPIKERIQGAAERMIGLARLVNLAVIVARLRVEMVRKAEQAFLHLVVAGLNGFVHIADRLGVFLIIGFRLAAVRYGAKNIHEPFWIFSLDSRDNGSRSRFGNGGRFSRRGSLGRQWQVWRKSMARPLTSGESVDCVL